LPYIEQAKNDTFHFEIYDNAQFLYAGASSFQDVLQIDIGRVGATFSISIILIILPALLFLSKNFDKKKDAFLLQCYVIGMIYFILSTKLIPWKQLACLQIIQFPFRFSIIYSLLLSYVAGEAVFRYFKNGESITVLVICMICINAIQLSKIDINIDGFSYQDMITYYPLGLQEYTPIYFNSYLDFICNVEDEPNIKRDKEGNFVKLVDENGKTVKKGNIKTIKYKRSGSRMEFNYEDSEKEINLHIPLTYYKGYVAYLVDEDGVTHDLTLEEEEKNDNIVISSSEKLTGKVIVEYRMTAIQKISYTTTFITMIVLVIYIIRKKIISQKVRLFFI
jgi:hypothetical protein